MRQNTRNWWPTPAKNCFRHLKQWEGMYRKSRIKKSMVNGRMGRRREDAFSSESRLVQPVPRLTRGPPPRSPSLRLPASSIEFTDSVPTPSLWLSTPRFSSIFRWPIYAILGQLLRCRCSMPGLLPLETQQELDEGDIAYIRTVVKGRGVLSELPKHRPTNATTKTELGSGPRITRC
jgi:hypothetical protein